MNRLVVTARWLFAGAFIVFAVQHFMYAKFVASLVPAYMPWRLFWAYFTGFAFLAAAVSFIANKQAASAATLLALMLGLFILMLHIPVLITPAATIMNWTRALQDTAIMASALMLTGAERITTAGRYIYGGALLCLGFQHFLHTAFITAKVPSYFGEIEFWDFFIGIFIILCALCVITGFKARAAAFLLAALLFLFVLLCNVPLLAANVKNGQQWTTVMLDLAVACGAVLMLNCLYKDSAQMMYQKS